MIAPLACQMLPRCNQHGPTALTSFHLPKSLVWNADRCQLHIDGVRNGLLVFNQGDIEMKAVECGLDLARRVVLLHWEATATGEIFQR